MATVFDAIIIGTGQADPSLARRLAGAGQKVAIIERKLFGCTCVNTGCIPRRSLPVPMQPFPLGLLPQTAANRSG